MPKTINELVRKSNCPIYNHVTYSFFISNKFIGISESTWIFYLFFWAFENTAKKIKAEIKAKENSWMSYGIF